MTRSRTTWSSWSSWTLLAALLTMSGRAYAQAPQTQADDESEPPMVTDSTGLDEAARQIFIAGRDLYDLGRFLEAAAQFEQAYELSHRAPLLYNVYVAYRDAGDRTKSAAALANYLRENPDAPDRVNLEARLRSLEESIQNEQNAQDRAAEEARTAELARQQDEERRQREEERRQAEEAGRSIVPWVVAASGGALVVAGAVVGGVALAQQGSIDFDACRDGLCPGYLGSDISSLQTVALVADVLLFGGAAIAAGGLIWALLIQSDSSDSDPSPQVACGATGCVASMHGSF